MGYLRITGALGALRGWYLSKDCKYFAWDYDKKEYIDRHLLVSERLHVGFFAGIMSPWAWPFFAFRDLKRLEMTYCGLDPKWHGAEMKSRFDALAIF
jgi:hypothetical protein